MYDKSRVKEREPNNPERLRVLEKLINEHNLTSGAELGVRSGELYYYLLCHCPNLHLLGVDAYKPISVGSGKRKKTLEPALGCPTYSYDFDSYHNFICELMEEFSPRATFIRKLTTEAAKEVPDNSLDFVFIDADHAYSSVLRDINDWSPKVKTGGFITGHDWWLADVQQAVQEKFGPLRSGSPPILTGNIKLERDHVWICQKK